MCRSGRTPKTCAIASRNRDFCRSPWSLGLESAGGQQAIGKDRPQDFIVFNQQFVALIKAGLPILRSLDLRVQIKTTLKRHIDDVHERVHSGAMLSEALRAQGVLPTVYNASIFAGEAETL